MPCCGPALAESSVPAQAQCNTGQQGNGEELTDVVAQLLGHDLDVGLQARRMRGKRILLRADLNVPVDSATQVVTDKNRITAVLPSIQALLAAGAKVIIASHFGRPDPKKQTWNEMVAKYSLAPVAQAFHELLGPSFIGLAPDCVGKQAEAFVESLQVGQACLLENTRFHLGDTKNDPAFAAALGELASVFVCDAFGVVHRDQGSVTGVTHYMEESYPGPLIRHELTFLSQYLDNPKRPLGVVMGGSKVADKIGVLWALIKKADVLLIGGRMAFTFLAAKGVCVGSTQVEESWLQPALEMLSAAEAKGVKLLLPCDVLVSSSLDAPKDEHRVELSTTCCGPEAPCVPAGHFGVDIGPASAAVFCEALSQCGTIFWNGPMGKFEVPAFAEGTQKVAQAVADATQAGAISVVGGGDSVAAVSQMGLASRVSHISTGGGASLEFIEGKGMPGLRSLAAAAPRTRAAAAGAAAAADESS